MESWTSEWNKALTILRFEPEVTQSNINVYAKTDISLHRLLFCQQVSSKMLINEEEKRIIKIEKYLIAIKYVIKGIVHSEKKFTHYWLTLMLMKNLV